MGNDSGFAGIRQPKLPKLPEINGQQAFQWRIFIGGFSLTGSAIIQRFHFGWQLIINLLKNKRYFSHLLSLWFKTGNIACFRLLRLLGGFC